MRALLVVPHRAVRTPRARAVLPDSVPLADAVHNTAHGALLMLGLAGGDPELVSRGLADVLHQPYRAHLYPRSAELLRGASGMGALGATISGAGPTVLVWVQASEAARVGEALRERVAAWAQVIEAPFVADGARAV